MKDITIATAQFEHKSGDKQYNLLRIEMLTSEASRQGARIVCFHELCITGYTFLRKLNRKELEELSEEIPGGPSISALTELARLNNVAILAGLLEKEQGELFNTYVCVTSDGLIAKHRKLHPFISGNLSAGDHFTVFKLFENNCGILICYDNNVIENVRATALMGAEIIFMPHVTGCTPSPFPGKGYVDPVMWKNKESNPGALRKEFDGPKSLEWLMKWLPARAFDNGVYVIFSNPVGMDDNQVKGGGSMVIDPFGNIIAECRNLDDQVVIAECAGDKIEKSGGHRYRKARRPELYKDILGMDNVSETKPAWLNG